MKILLVNLPRHGHVLPTIGLEKRQAIGLLTSCPTAGKKESQKSVRNDLYGFVSWKRMEKRQMATA